MIMSNDKRAKAIAVILAFNEASRISQTVENAKQTFNTVCVLDSVSNDQTVEMAKAAGAQIISNKFVNFAAQRNFAIDAFKNDYDWLFFLDADEEIEPELSQNLKVFLEQIPEKPIALKMRRKNFFLGKMLNHVAGKDYQTRLFGKFGELKYVGEVHEGIATPELERQTIEGHIIHNSYETITDLFAKTNTYTSLEVSKKKSYSTKILIVRLLFLPSLTFFKSYFLRKGFLDGYRGFIYASFMAIYKFVLISKQIEKNFKD